MSETVASSISGTGTYRVLDVPAQARTGVADGKVAKDSGKVLPPEQPKQDLKVVAEQLNVASQSIGRELRFEVNLDSGRSVIQVLDRETGEIIRQIQPEDVTPNLNVNGALEVRLYDEIV